MIENHLLFFFVFRIRDLYFIFDGICEGDEPFIKVNFFLS